MGKQSREPHLIAVEFPHSDKYPPNYPWVEFGDNGWLPMIVVDGEAEAQPILDCLKTQFDDEGIDFLLYPKSEFTEAEWLRLMVIMREWADEKWQFTTVWLPCSGPPPRLVRHDSEWLPYKAARLARQLNDVQQELKAATETPPDAEQEPFPNHWHTELAPQRLKLVKELWGGTPKSLNSLHQTAWKGREVQDDAIVRVARETNKIIEKDGYEITFRNKHFALKRLGQKTDK